MVKYFTHFFMLFSFCILPGGDRIESQDVYLKVVPFQIKVIARKNVGAGAAAVA